MPSTIFNLPEMEEGADYTYQLTFYQDDAGTIPVDLTGFTIQWQVRDRDDGTLLIDLGTYTTITDAVNGEAQVLVPYTDTVNLSFERGKQDLFLFSGSSREKIWRGEVSTQADVTEV